MSKPVKVIFGVACLSTSLPIVSEYVMSFCLLIWLVGSSAWRLALVNHKSIPPPGSPDHSFMRLLATGIRPLHWGVLAYVVTHLIAALMASAFSEFGRPFGKTIAVWSHVGLKLGVEWLVLSCAMIAAARRGWNPRRGAPWLLGWLAAQFIYSVAQRYTGIDWVHGWHAVLPGHRFAYGVYRISAFMGHPLTLAYNLMLILVAGCAMTLRLRPPLPLRESKVWWGIIAFSAATLLISGSRFVLIVIILALAWGALGSGRKISRYWRWIAGLAAVLALALWAEGSIVGRFGEVLDPGVPLLARFPRLVFWRVHWQMFVDHPLYGVGMAGVDDAMRHYYTAAGYHDNMYPAHNIFLQTLADTGLIGLAGLLALVIGLVLAAKRLRRATGHAQGISYLTAATLLTGLMQNDLRDSEYLYAFWFFLSLLLVQSAALGAGRQESDDDERKPPENLQSPAGRPDPA